MLHNLEYDSYSNHGRWRIVFHTYGINDVNTFYCVDNAGYHLCYPSYCLKRSNYNSYILLFTLQGHGRLLYGNKTYTLSNNNALFIHCKNYHEYYPLNDKHWIVFWMHFYGGNSAEFCHYLTGARGPVLETNAATNLKLTMMINKIITLKRSDDHKFAIKASWVISDILHQLSESVSLPEEPYGASYQIAAAIDYIKSAYANDINLDDIAHSVHLSKFYFCKLFKAITGFSPYEYLVRYRIEKSKMLLSLSEDSIAKISSMVGFKNPSGFISSFHHYEGITPLQFRKKKMIQI